jgi:hypothetical protein
MVSYALTARPVVGILACTLQLCNPARLQYLLVVVVAAALQRIVLD